MVFDTNISASLRCRKCGRFFLGDMSFFEMKNAGGSCIKCECGEVLMTVKSHDSKTFHVYIPCLMCDKEHSFVFTWKSMPWEKVKILNCPSSSCDIAFIGGRALIRSLTAKRKKDMQELIELLSSS